MTDRVMIDIETLGLDPGAAILSVGAVEFDTDGLGEEFYHVVDLESCQDAGLHIDANTLDWWLSQDDAVTDILTGGEPLANVLAFLQRFVPEDAEVWANSPSFDCEMLEVAYDAVDMAEPWTYDKERDVRTVMSLPGAVEVEMEGDEHNALDDAKRQARSVSKTLARLEGVEA